MSHKGTRVGVIGVGLLAAACGSEGSVRIDASLAESPALAMAEQVGATLRLPASSGALVIESVTISLSELEFEGGDGDVEFETGGRTVAVALGDAATAIAVESVSEGTYDQIGLEFAPAGAITATGSYGAGSFTYVSSLAPEVEFDLDPPAVVSDGAEAQVAVSFDVAAWFLGGDGLALDPGDPANRTTIENNILSSISAQAAEVELGDDD